jgi:hypothetical protein
LRRFIRFSELELELVVARVRPKQKVARVNAHHDTNLGPRTRMSMSISLDFLAQLCGERLIPHEIGEAEDTSEV